MLMFRKLINNILFSYLFCAEHSWGTDTVFKLVAIKILGNITLGLLESGLANIAPWIH